MNGIFRSRLLLILGATCCLVTGTPGAAAREARPSSSRPVVPHWSRPQIEQLLHWMKSAEADALATVAADIPAVEAALASGTENQLDVVASAAATRLLEVHRQGCCNAALRTGWHIAAEPLQPAAEAAVAAAVASDGVDALFRSARPVHPYYNSLLQAYMRERDPARRATLAANLDRWRWMPRNLGSQYILVNTAAFEATLWKGEQMIDRWAVIVGKTRSPTPVFRTNITGVTFNPWWEIPRSIAAESVAKLIGRHPAEAAAKGYVLQAGRYRQRPGPGNALGRMKLVMPNPYNVYLHDTPTQALFAQDVRAFSHGCVRVGDALGLATALLAERPEWSRAQVDAVVASGQTVTVALKAAIPVYVSYFTAEPDGAGSVRYFKDVYGRDRGATALNGEGRCGIASK